MENFVDSDSKFYQNLRESGIKEKGKYATTDKLAGIMKERKLSLSKLGALAKVADSTVGAARAGKRISIKKADQIAETLMVKTNDIFTVCESTEGLADKTVLHHHNAGQYLFPRHKDRCRGGK